MESHVIQGYRLSPQQKRLWSLQQVCGSLHFKAHCAVMVEGVLDTVALTAAVEDVIDRHQILRTTFDCPYGFSVPVQVIGRAALEFSSDDLCGMNEREQMDRVTQMISDAAKAPLDCERGPRVCASLARLSQDKHVLVVSLPALCSDGAGLCNIVREISSSYADYVNDERSAGEALQYIIASEWQNELFESEDCEVGKVFWRKQDVSSLDGLQLPFSGQTDTFGEFDPAFIAVTIGPDKEAAINAIAERYKVSVATFLLSCWHILLGRLTGESSITVGVRNDGRSDDEMMGAVGLFAKYLPICAPLNDRLRFAELLGQINAVTQEADEWQEWFTWEHLGGITADQADTMFFPLCFDFEESPAVYRSAAVTFTVYEQRACTDRFELKLRCLRGKDRVIAEFHYNAAAFAAADAGVIAAEYQKLVESAIETPEAMVSDLEMVSDRQRLQLLNDFNDSWCEYPRDKCIHELFEEQAACTSDSIAVAYADHNLTYAELNKRANQLAHRLRREGAGSETLIPFCFDRSVEVIVCVLGILKAGAAYVPMDPAYPTERLAFIIADVQATMVVTEEKFAENFGDLPVTRILLDRDWTDISRCSPGNPSPISTSGNLAYAIYTSGSTGKPKGVMIEHRSVINLLAALRQAVYDDELKSPLVVSLNAPMAFDASVQQMVMLLRGERLEVISQAIRTDARLLLSHLAERQVDVFDCTPSQLKMLLEAGLLENEAYRPQALLIAGEAIEKSVWKDLVHVKGTAFYNIYGPTECTVDATVCRLNLLQSEPNIGKPLANYNAYLLDGHLRMAPIGATAHLYIGGAGLARGYVNGPELTAQRFFPDEFGQAVGGRIYKTGDLGRHDRNGRIEYAGRIDDQVKLRGYRIELGEIEAVLLQHRGIRRCAVTVREDEPGDKRLVAYVVEADEKQTSRPEFLEYLKGKLPQYMVPSAFVKMTVLPLTANGKLDRKSLPAPRKADGEGAVTPRDATELCLFKIWSEVLKTENFGIHDNFFELGGHSLNAVALLSSVGELYGEKISVNTLFGFPTVAQMASHLRKEVALLPPSALIPIQPSGTRPPFFCVHPASGLAQVYLSLARCLGPDQPFYGLQTFETDLSRIPDSTVEEMAALYVAEVRRVQPVGPYYVGGWSFGATVAYEMAQQLLASNESVSLLAILDASSPSAEADDRPLTEEEMEIKLHDRVAGYCTRQSVLEMDEAASLSTLDLVRLLVNHHKAEAREGGPDGMVELTEAHYLMWFRNQVVNTHAKNRYRARPYPGRVTLFRGNSDRAPDYGWGEWALGGLDVHFSDSDHAHFASLPNAVTLAAQLAEYLGASDHSDFAVEQTKS